MDESIHHLAKPLNPLLKLAALHGVIAAVKLHIKRGDEINAIDEKGRSPLLLAVTKGHIETAFIIHYQHFLSY